MTILYRSLPRARFGILTLLTVLCLARVAVPATASAASYSISNFAGPGGNTGPDDANGTAARFFGPNAVAVGSNGNVYVADTSNHTIRVVSSGGVVTTLAGLSGYIGYADGAGATAGFYLPYGIATDSTNNVYVADTYNHTIRKITPSGVVTTLAGSAGLTGTTDGTGSTARFNYPIGIAVDSAGTVYVGDSTNHTIRKITAAGVVTTLAGTAGTSGTTDATGTAAKFNSPQGLSVDTSGTVYVADCFNHAIRKITAAGVVTTVAGKAGTLGYANGTGTAATFYYPSGLHVDNGGTIYVADSNNLVIRKITSTNVVTTFAGTAFFGGTDGAGIVATFSYPSDIAGDSFGNLYVSDSGNNTIRKITSAAVVSTVAGAPSTIGSANGSGTSAYFYYPQGIATDTAGNFYVSDTANHAIRKVTPAGVVSTLAGLAGTFGTLDGTGTNALFDYPQGLALDSTGNVFVADYYNHTIRKITPAGVVTTFAGTAGTLGSADGTGTAAKFNYPLGVAIDSLNNVYVADSGNYTIRKISPAGLVSTYAGTSGVVGSANGTGPAASFYVPSGLATDTSNNVYVTDQYNHTIRKIAPGGVVTTVAGHAGINGSADGNGTAAYFYLPYGIKVDAAGNIYVADFGNQTIRFITPANDVTTLAGSPLAVGSLNGTGTSARFYNPSGIALDASGNFYVVDSGNQTIRVGKPTITDAAIIDSTSGSIGVARQLDTAPQTATSWNWSIYRKPANSTAVLSSTTIRNPTFTPDVADVYVFKLTASSVSGSSTTLVGLSSADAAPSITSALTTTGVVAQTFSYQITANGFPGATYTASPLPDGLTYSLGYIFGTPTSVGVTNVTLTATNSVGTDTKNLAITINQAPTIVSSLVATGQVGQAFSYTLQALGSPASTFTTGTLPAGLTLVGNKILGTPTIGSITNVTLTASNGILPNDQKTLVITINQSPVITSTLTATGSVGKVFSYTIQSTGIPAATYTAAPLPTGLSLVGNIISGTPTSIGSTDVVLTASNGIAPDDAKTVTITVTPVAPIFSSTPSAAPNPALVGALIQFNGAATNPLPLTYAWDFGDGSTGTGASVSHVYPHTGTFTAKIVVTSSANATTEATILVTINPLVGGNPGAGSGTLVGETDSDGDGYSDVIETAAGTSTTNPASAPGGFSFAPAAIAIVKPVVKISTTKKTLTMTGTLQIPPNFVPLDKVCVIDIGGFTQHFTLDAKGAALTVKDKLKITLKLTNGVAAEQFSKFSITLNGIPSNILSTSPAIIVLNGVVFSR
ncbi:MAG: PKD domain-containing protein [Planctomycetota bacterium]